MAYSQDLRDRVVGFVGRGNPKKEAALCFNLGLRTVERWCKRQREEGTSEARRPGRRAGCGKVDLKALEEDVRKDPDATLKERGQRFKVSAVAIWKRLRQMRVVYKKNTALRRAR